MQRVHFRTLSTLALAACLAVPAYAQVTVKEAWVRASVPQQMATGAFMQLSSAGGARLVQASTPVAGVVQLHEMAMDGTTMKMREVAEIELPPGKTVELKPGGYHVMLMDLKQTLKEGDTVALTLVVQGKDGKRETIAVKAPVRPLGAPAAAHKP